MARSLTASGHIFVRRRFVAAHCLFATANAVYYAACQEFVPMPKGDEPKIPTDSSPETRQDCVAVNLSLEISGLDLEGKDFVTEARARLVSRTGASIVTRKLLAPEQTITVKRTGPHPEAEVSVIGQIGSEPDGNIYAVALVEPSAEFWGIDFPPGETQPTVLLLECPICRIRQNVVLRDFELIVLESNNKISRRCPKCHDVTLWKRSSADTATETGTFSAAGQAAPAAPEAVPAPPPQERRRQTRLKVNLKGLITFGGQETPIEVEDMSRGGVRFRARRQFILGLTVRAAIPYTPGGSNIFVSAKICWSKHGPDGTSEYGLQYVKD
jgi:PilZ domain